MSDEPAEETEATEEPILTGRRASVHEKFWVKKLWELEADSPAILTEASQQLMNQMALVSGIYLATLGLFGVEGVACPWIKISSLLPYAVWLPGLLLAYLASRPQRWTVPWGDAQGSRDEMLELADRKRKLMERAEICLLVGLVLAVAWVGFFLFQSGAPAGAGG